MRGHIRQWTIMLLIACFAQAQDEFRPNAGMLKYPDISSEHIVFVYAGDIWLAPRLGGTAWLLANPVGIERFPKFSPDGTLIVFSGNYDGNSDLYSLPITGGIPNRLTHHPTRETLSEFTPDGQSILFHAFGLDDHPHNFQIFQVGLDGGLPQKLPVPYGSFGTIHSAGAWLAYTPMNRDGRTWKRYRGGWASDIWLFNLEDGSSRQVTDFEGTDTQPMWHGDTLYYLSDAHPSHRLNLYVYDLNSGETKAVTDLSEYDIKWPSIGPGAAGEGEIVFQYGAQLMVIDLSTAELRELEISIPGARPYLRPQDHNAAKNIMSAAISPTGKRVVMGARGDIWSVPAKKGSVRNLTQSNGKAERDPSWSPDGQWIAYFSDARDSYDLYVTQSDGFGDTRRVTDLKAAYLIDPVWSPDSKSITFWDTAGNLYLTQVADGTTRILDTDPSAGSSRVKWSPDNQWLTYTKSETPGMTSIWIAHAEKGETHRITADMFRDSAPCFDRKGEVLYFLSCRDFTRPIYEDVGTTWVYAGTEEVFAFPLRRDLASPVAVESDEETFGAKKDDAKGEEKTKPKKKKKDGKDKADEEEAEPEKVEPFDIHFGDAESRVVSLPIKPGRLSRLEVNDKGHLLFQRNGVEAGSRTGTVSIVDLEDEKREEKTVVSDVTVFMLSSDGKKVLAAKGDTFAIVDAAPEQEFKPMDFGALNVTIDPRQEWAQVFHEAWRLVRDFFYDPNMHGVDWPAVKAHYGAMLPDCSRREDVSDLIREMIAELNVGHAYYFDQDLVDPPNLPVGLLGADFALENGAYRISRIYHGGPWDIDARGPLSQPGIEVKTGDYILEVNGIPLDTDQDPWASFAGLADKVVTLTVSDQPKRDENARQIVVKLHDFRRDMGLRFRSWIESKRAYVDEQTEGKVGYIYVTDTGRQGQNDLVRQFFGQKNKDALIIDERWNGGGQIPTRFVELLNRPLANIWALREGRDVAWPPDAHFGPKCMLINGMAGSGGDYFPFWFRAAGLGKLIGTRTWGGLVGLSGNPGLIDGGYVSIPQFAFYEKDGSWGIEGHGVDPDIEVKDDPALMTDGGDPQLDAAIHEMLQEIQSHPFTLPQRPPYPDRSGMGILEADK